MAPSTSTPTDLHRAPVACLQCRGSKVRCLVSAECDRCDRCRTNATQCVFTQPKRAKARTRAQPYPPQHQGRDVQKATDDQRIISSDGLVGGQAVAPQSGSDEPSPLIQPPPPLSASSRINFDDNIHPLSGYKQPVITDAIRASIVRALATMKGRRGSPFSFVTSGDSPSFGTSSNPDDETPRDSSWQDSSAPSEATASSLKLSRILRPLKISSQPESNNEDNDWQHTGSVKMPSYLASMTLGQTITDPIESGIISLKASCALFEFFMVHMNAKWEYVLDPHTDTHDSTRKRNALLFASILFCSSKFVNSVEDELCTAPDQFLQSRLCSLARNLVINTIAKGDRSIETMQALYLLVCWKDPDDDISYLHSGYAFRILHDLDLGAGVCDGRQMARRKRTWLALFRQDQQQSLFFLRRASLNQADDDLHLSHDIDALLHTPHSLPLDFLGCCSADIRYTQSRIRHMAQNASMSMLPCLLESMDTEMKSWRSKWNNYLEGEGRERAEKQPTTPSGSLYPDRQHITTLVAVWENGVRLNVSSAILRQALISSVTSSLDPIDQRIHSHVNIDLSTIHEGLSFGLPGLASSVESAFETLRHLMRFPMSDIRRAPDAILLLAPNAALFLCLLLCLPGNGILGPAFQRTAVGLIRDIAHHLHLCVQSPQDVVALHAAYLESLVDLLDPSISEQPSVLPQPAFANLGTAARSSLDLDSSALQTAQVLTNGVFPHGYDAEENDTTLGITNDTSQNLHLQSLANLLDGYCPWEIPSDISGVNFS